MQPVLDSLQELSNCVDVLLLPAQLVSVASPTNTFKWFIAKLSFNFLIAVLFWYHAMTIYLVGYIDEFILHLVVFVLFRVTEIMGNILDKQISNFRFQAYIF